MKLRKNLLIAGLLLMWSITVHAQQGRFNFQEKEIGVNPIKIDEQAQGFSVNLGKFNSFDALSYPKKYWKTRDSVNNYYKSKYEDLKRKIEDITNEESRKRVEEELNTLKKEHQNTLELLRSNYDLIQKSAYQARNSSLFDVFPVRNEVDAQMFYLNGVRDKKTQFLKNSILSFSTEGNKVSVFNEIYADFFGPIRVGFGVLVSNSSENQIKDSTGAVIAVDSLSALQDATQRLLGAGGNGVVSFAYPVFDYENVKKSLLIKADLFPKLSVDVPALGTIDENFARNLDIGLELFGAYTGGLDKLTFYTYTRFGRVSGNKAFYANLLKDDNKAFFFHQLSVGLNIDSTFRLAWNHYWGSDFVNQNFNSSISFSIIPKN